MEDNQNSTSASSGTTPQSGMNHEMNPQPGFNPGLPPYLTPRPPRFSRPGEKLLMIGVMSIVLMIGALCVLGLTDSRKSTAENAFREISGSGNYDRHSREEVWSERLGDTDETSPAEGWGGPVSVTGPFVCANDTTGRCVLPALFDCDIKVKTHTLHRGPYEYELFESPVEMSGTFDGAALRALGRDTEVRVNLDIHAVTQLGKLTVDGRDIDWQFDTRGLYAVLDTAMLADSVKFATTFALRGSQSVSVTRMGAGSHITIGGDASNPSFGTTWMPVDRTLTDTTFSALWQGPIALDATQISELGNLDRATVSFLVGVDNYQKVERMLKYAILIIVLTFLSVWVIEIVWRHPIPLLNYFLIGAALVVCYALLLSISEYTGFGVAYLISTAMTVALITAYMWLMLSSRRVACVTALFLTLLYGVCYIMLCAETYALLMGTVLLFVAVAGAMYGTLRLRHPNAD